jgi:hypothetical protein
MKELIGDETFKKVEADLNGKELILNDGNYIPKKTFDDKLDEIKTLTKEKETLTGNLKTSQESLKKMEDEKKIREQG